MDTQTGTDTEKEALRAGTRVDVHTRYHLGWWAPGFFIAEVRPDGYGIRRASDGAVLDETIQPGEIRVVRPVPSRRTSTDSPERGHSDTDRSPTLNLKLGSEPMTTIARPRSSSNTPSHEDRPSGTPVDPYDAGARLLDVIVLESCHCTWIFDSPRRRFCRILKGIEVKGGSVTTAWRPYWRVQLDPESEGFIIYLNEARTRLIRSWRHTKNCDQCGGCEATEVSIQAIERTLHEHRDSSQKGIAQ
jgi:hypothetical protein